MFSEAGKRQLSGRSRRSQMGALINPSPTIDTLPNGYVVSEQVLSLLRHTHCRVSGVQLNGFKGIMH